MQRNSQETRLLEAVVKSVLERNKGDLGFIPSPMKENETPNEYQARVLEEKEKNEARRAPEILEAESEAAEGITEEQKTQPKEEEKGFEEGTSAPRFQGGLKPRPEFLTNRREETYDREKLRRLRGGEESLGQNAEGRLRSVVSKVWNFFRTLFR